MKTVMKRLRRVSNNSVKKIPILIARILQIWRTLETLQNAFRNAGNAKARSNSMPAVQKAQCQGEAE